MKKHRKKRRRRARRSSFAHHASHNVWGRPWISHWELPPPSTPSRFSFQTPVMGNPYAFPFYSGISEQFGDSSSGSNEGFNTDRGASTQSQADEADSTSGIEMHRSTAGHVPLPHSYSVHWGFPSYPNISHSYQYGNGNGHGHPFFPAQGILHGSVHPGRFSCNILAEEESSSDSSGSRGSHSSSSSGQTTKRKPAKKMKIREVDPLREAPLKLSSKKRAVSRKLKGRKRSYKRKRLDVSAKGRIRVEVADTSAGLKSEQGNLEEDKSSSSSNTSEELEHSATKKHSSKAKLSRPVRKRKQTKTSKKPQRRSSRYKGVSWHKHDHAYVARVWANGRSEHIGMFKSELAAAVAVDKRLIELHGKDYAGLNFPLG